MDKFEFNCNQLKNIEVPEQWVNKALEIPSKAPKAAPQKSYYRYVAAIAASVVLASAVIIFVMFGMNKNVNLTNPISDSPSKSDSFNSESKPDSTDNTNPSGKSPAFSGADNSPSEFTISTAHKLLIIPKKQKLKITLSQIKKAQSHPKPRPNLPVKLPNPQRSRKPLI